MKNLKRLLILLSVLSTPSWAKWVPIDGFKINLDTPSNWIYRKNMMGMPLIWMSPIKKEARMVIQIADTGADQTFFNPKLMKDKENTYRSKKVEWLERNGGKLDAFISMKFEKGKHVKKIASMGVRYTIADIAYEEKSYYLVCEKQIFHMKSLLREDEFINEKYSISKVMNSFNCKRSEAKK